MKAFSLSLTTLMYHYVRDPSDYAEASSGIPGLLPAYFEAQLDYLAQHYSMIAWTDLQAYLLGHGELPRDACLLTFDDGVCDHYINVFPRLRARGLSGLFFALARQPDDDLVLAHKIHFLLARLGVVGLRDAIWAHLDPGQRLVYSQAEESYRTHSGGSDVELLKAILQRDLSIPAEAILSDLFDKHIGAEAPIASEYYLTSDQIAEMTAHGMHFGGHSRRHPWFDWVSPADQADEIGASAAWLQSIAPGPFPFAYPYGGYHAESPQLLKAHGFAAAFTTVTRVRHADPFFIGRIDGDALPHPPALSQHGDAIGS